jgi:microcystin-dependent protein
MTLYHWSQTAALNANADSTCPFPEGMAPSALNDGTRGMMAAVAKYRDDIAGAIVTTGTPNFYSLSSYQAFDNATDMNGKLIAFTPHVTNAGTATLNVDGLGGKPLRSGPGVELQPGTIIQGTPYTALYNNTDGAFYLRGFYGNPYNIPLLGGIDFWGFTAPNSSFVFPVGQAISRTVYAAAFALVGTAFGAGDGSTTFNLPDKRGRVSAGIDSMGGIAANQLPGYGLGSMGGEQTHALTVGEIPPLAVNGTTGQDSPDHTHSLNGGLNFVVGNGGGATSPGGSAYTSLVNGSTTISSVSSGASARHTHSFGAFTNGGGQAHNNVQPTIACNYIMRII